MVHKNFLYLVFQSGDKQVNRQVSLRELKFFEKEYIISPIYFQNQPSKGALLRDSSSAIVARNLEKYLGNGKDV